MATWRELIKLRAGEDTILQCTLTDEELDKEFDDGYGVSQGKRFSAWSKKYVYFPAVYDGREWVERAPRNPCDETTAHVGGE